METQRLQVCCQNYRAGNRHLDEIIYLGEIRFKSQTKSSHKRQKNTIFDEWFYSKRLSPKNTGKSKLKYLTPYMSNTF